MLYYIVIVVLFFLSFTKAVKGSDFIFLSCLCGFLCFGYMTGSDWRVYEEAYYNHFQLRLVEPGYMLLSNLCADLNVDFWFFHIAIKIICFFLVSISLKRFVRNGELYFSLMLFCASFGFFLFIDCPFRNLIAISIFLFASKYFDTKDYVKYFFFVLLASSFHFSALFLFLLPILRFDKIRTRYLVLIYFSFLVFLAVGGFSYLLSFIAYLVPTLYSRLSYYENTGLVNGNIFSVGLVLRITCLFLMMYYRIEIFNRCQKPILVFNMCFFYLLLSLLSYSIPIFFRFPFYLSLFYVIMICYCLRFFYRRNFIIMKLFYLIVSLVITFTTLTSKPYYVPYTNILFYIGDDHSSDYNYRSNYNFINSPYK